jgi:hypothetical protein
MQPVGQHACQLRKAQRTLGRGAHCSKGRSDGAGWIKNDSGDVFSWNWWARREISASADATTHPRLRKARALDNSTANDTTGRPAALGFLDARNL